MQLANRDPRATAAGSELESDEQDQRTVVDKLLYDLVDVVFPVWLGDVEDHRTMAKRS
jgi:hypothetical protein